MNKVKRTELLNNCGFRNRTYFVETEKEVFIFTNKKKWISFHNLLNQNSIKIIKSQEINGYYKYEWDKKIWFPMPFKNKKKYKKEDITKLTNINGYISCFKLQEGEK